MFKSCFCRTGYASSEVPPHVAEESVFEIRFVANLRVIDLVQDLTFPPK